MFLDGHQCICDVGQTCLLEKTMPGLAVAKVIVAIFLFMYLNTNQSAETNL